MMNSFSVLVDCPIYDAHLQDVVAMAARDVIDKKAVS